MQVDYHKLAHEHAGLLKEIRKIPGFERFLLPKTLAQLLPDANQGPIVMLNVSQLQCDALVLIPGCDDILHIPLDNLTLTEALTWHQAFQFVMAKNC